MRQCWLVGAHGGDSRLEGSHGGPGTRACCTTGLDIEDCWRSPPQGHGQARHLPPTTSIANPIHNWLVSPVPTSLASGRRDARVHWIARG